MDLLSVFKRQSGEARPVDTTEPLDSVASARRRARQRLIGATILVVIAVVGFPMVFDTAPRPVPVDVPIEIPRKEGAAPLVMPPSRAPGIANSASGSAPPVVASNDGSAAAPTTPAAAHAASGAAGIITETQHDAGREVKPPVPDARASVGQPGPPPAARRAATAAAERAAPHAAEKAAAARQATPPADAGRARALLEDKPVAKADITAASSKAAPAAAVDSRFVVQVAAFSGDQAASEMRAKLEKAGVKSYTQVVETPAGRRIRVRVGPFNTRDEAEKAAGKIKSAGLPWSIVPL